MYTPTNTPVLANLTHITAVDMSLHTFLGASWHILLPYTIFGGALMVYSQTRLVRGQRALARASRQK